MSLSGCLLLGDLWAMLGANEIDAHVTCPASRYVLRRPRNLVVTCFLLPARKGLPETRYPGLSVALGAARHAIGEVTDDARNA